MSTKKYNEFINEGFPHHADPKYQPEPKKTETWPLTPVKFSDVSDEMLDGYIEECEESFPTGSDSMNLVRFTIEKLRKSIEENNETDITAARKTMMMWYKNSLCQRKKLLCDHCENPMEMNYTPKCYHCDESKPKIVKNEVNYFDVVRWISKREPDFDEDDFWSDLTEWKVRGNDSYFSLSPSDVSNEYIAIIAKHYDLDGLKWWVSW